MAEEGEKVKKEKEIKHFTKEQCKKIDDLLYEWQMGTADFIVIHDKEEYKNGVCIIAFRNIGNIDLGAYGSNINALSIKGSRVKDMDIKDLIIDNKITFDRSNIEELRVIDSKINTFDIIGPNPYETNIHDLYLGTNKIDSFTVANNDVGELKLLGTNVDVAVKDTVSKINFEKYEPK